MQPNPMAETSRLLFPSFRLRRSIAFAPGGSVPQVSLEFHLRGDTPALEAISSFLNFSSLN
jgi:hypothetical protein